MYEGRILGSNIGCIATYTLEVLIIYLLINFSDDIETPLDVYFKFFEVYGNFDWDHYLVTIFGFIKIDDVVNGIISIDEAIHNLTHDEDGEIK